MFRRTNQFLSVVALSGAFIGAMLCFVFTGVASGDLQPVSDAQAKLVSGGQGGGPGCYVWVQGTQTVCSTPCTSTFTVPYIPQGPGAQYFKYIKCNQQSQETCMYFAKIETICGP